MQSRKLVHRRWQCDCEGLFVEVWIEKGLLYCCFLQNDFKAKMFIYNGYPSDKKAGCCLVVLRMILWVSWMLHKKFFILIQSFCGKCVEKKYFVVVTIRWHYQYHKKLEHETISLLITQASPFLFVLLAWKKPCIKITNNIPLCSKSKAVCQGYHGWH